MFAPPLPVRARLVRQETTFLSSSGTANAADRFGDPSSTVHSVPPRASHLRRPLRSSPIMHPPATGAPRQNGAVDQRARPRPSAGTATRARARLLVVDDEPSVLHAHARLLRAMDFDVDEQASPVAALDLLRQARYDLLVADVRMPQMSGFELTKAAHEIDPELAVVMVSGLNDASTATRAFRDGALDFVTKPVELPELEAVVREALHRRALLREQRRVERMVRDEVTLRTAELEREKGALRALTVSMAESLINAMEAKDVYLRGHSHRVAALAAAIAEELELSPDAVEQVRLAGRLHDVGKIGTREAVLNKPGKLTPEEYEHVKQHVAIGMQILQPLTYLGRVLTYVHHHHEHWDGSGYPQGLVGDAISFGGRILTAADVYDALTSARAYREPMSMDEALALIELQCGSLLDPQVFEALERVVRRRQSLPFLEVA